MLVDDALDLIGVAEHRPARRGTAVRKPIGERHRGESDSSRQFEQHRSGEIDVRSSQRGLIVAAQMPQMLWRGVTLVAAAGCIRVDVEPARLPEVAAPPRVGNLRDNGR